MCGRYSLTVDQEALSVALGVEGFTGHVPRYNVAPSQVVPVVRRRPIGTGGPSLEGVLLRWGFSPVWATPDRKGPRPINARAETAYRSPLFRNAFRSGRCLVPADGFFEWQKSAAGKVPWWIHRPDRAIFAFAGLWEAPGGSEAPEDGTFTILTTTPNQVVAPLHQRMPVVLPREDWHRWLDPEVGLPAVRELLRPYPDDLLTAHPVSARVNSPRTDDPSLVDPVEPPL